MNKKPTSRSPNTAWPTGWNDGLGAVEAEQVQAQSPAARERAKLIKELLLLKFHVAGGIGDIVKRAADMLEADAREIAATERQVEILSDELSKCDKAQQVAVPALKIKPFTQRLRDNREADYSLDALMPPTRKEIESAMHEEIVELRNTLKAQQVAVPDGLIDAIRWAAEFISAVHQVSRPQTHYPINLMVLRRFSKHKE